MLNFKNRSIATIGAIAATFVTFAAVSPARAEGREAHVAYADLDLGSPQGAATLERRIVRAAGRVCRSADAAQHRAVAQCRRDAVTRAQASLPAVDTSVQFAAR